MCSASRVISPTAVYDTTEVCELLGIGDDKLRRLVSTGRLRRLMYTERWRFWGAELIKFCGRETWGAP